ncbi:MAG: N-acetylmuramoyl-L-alanine amidase [Candidatus Promineifilaceae bacterium]|nr:N-acetylmuramoyl-L-alanine amidase [Candidatus Promineifilaceae bacterium]
MSSPYDDNTWESSTATWIAFLGRILPFVVFFVVAAAGMYAAYLFFSPDGSEIGVVETVRSAGLSAPFFKAVPQKPAQQRLAQSPGPIRIAIISGHRNFDPGAVCEDGLTEAEVNLNIAEKVVANLRLRGIRAMILDEYDDQLQGFSGTALISIHADSCEYFNDQATGYKIAGSAFADSSLLQSCMENTYQSATQLSYHPGTVTADMLDYHAFYEIAQGTPAIIIETGFMNLDRELLTERSDIPANAITDGILCFLNAS